ncbi:response regulator [Clostridium lacusfryxellense]|nr:response regulator [Clostridium lacusfryxellense]
MDKSKINILIVDNNKEFCNILNEYISNQKDMIVTGIAENGVEALNLVKEKKPDLIILDIIMPLLDGLGVLERLNKMNLNPIPHVIVLSSIGLEKIIQRALLLGADYYIVKPFELVTFMNRIRQCMCDVEKPPYTKIVSTIS